MCEPAAYRLVDLYCQLTRTSDVAHSPAGVDSFLASVASNLHDAEIIVPVRAMTSAAKVTAQLGPRVTPSDFDELPQHARRLAITIYSSRSEAHDWLAGEAGAWRRSMRCLEKLVEQDLPVDVEVVLTRPAVQQLPELAELLGRIRPSRVVFRFPVAGEVPDDRRVMLVPRMPIAIPAIESAVQRLERSRITAVAENVPLCAGAPDLPRRVCRVSTDAPIEMLHCAGCDASRCSGVQRDYVATFGWTDFAAQSPRAGVVLVPLRAPSPLRCRRCADDGEETSSRAMRMHLVRAASTGARTLRIVGTGAFWHRDAPSLLRDATRMSFGRVEVAGEASGLARFTDSQMARLNGITSIDFPLYGPTAATHDMHDGVSGSWSRTWSAIERVREFAGVEAKPFAVVHDLRDVPAQAEAWLAAFGSAAPRFRLSDGIDSQALADCIDRVKEPAIRSALAPLLPSCCYTRPDSPHDRNEWLCEEQLRSSFPRSHADPINDPIRCARCDSKQNDVAILA
jgi:hypothetical protein